MSRFDSVGWRLAGSIASWVLFVFSFVGLFQAAAAVMSLGGSCASGGPYVIETECPESVLVFAPLGFFGMLLAVGVALFLARGFGVSLIAGAWPILFVGLSIPFFTGAETGDGIVVNILLGLMFVVMALAPVVVLVFSKTLVPTLVGSRNIVGDRFAYAGTLRRYFGLKPAEGGTEVSPTPRDWAISLGLWVVSVVGGGWLSLFAFHAVAAAG